jgi:hypothetical protein
MPEPLEVQEAEWGERMIEVKIRFWTNDIAKGKGQIQPKHAWTSGLIRMERNDAHGIKPKHSRKFNSLSEIPAVIEKVLIEHGVHLHLERAMSKYLE